MKIIVCIKVVPDISVLNFDLDSRCFDPDDFVYIVNPLDLVALEAALGIRERVGSGEIICLSVGPTTVMRHLRQCLAMGSDRAVLLWDVKFVGSDGFAIATVLAAAIRKMGFDLILCGREAQDDEGGIVGPTMAGILNIPHITAITRLKIPKGSQKVEVHRVLERGEREILECSVPALFTVHQAMNEPRYPSFPSSLEALRKEIPVLGLQELDLRREQVGVRGSQTNIINFSLPRPRPKVAIRMDSSLSPAERMKVLVSGGLSEKRGDLLEGDPKELAQRILKILEREKKHIRKGRNH